MKKILKLVGIVIIAFMLLVVVIAIFSGGSDSEEANTGSTAATQDSNASPSAASSAPDPATAAPTVAPGPANTPSSAPADTPTPAEPDSMGELEYDLWVITDAAKTSATLAKLSLLVTDLLPEDEAWRDDISPNRPGHSCPPGKAYCHFRPKCPGP